MAQQAVPTVDLGSGVRVSVGDHSGPLPLFIEPLDDDLRTSLPAARQWLHDRRATLDSLLLQHGALVYRGFPVAESGDFRSFVSDYGFADLSYTAGATKRGAVEKDVYEATALPPDVLIPLHQEMSYLARWPQKLAFFCHVPAEAGGETIIGDMRLIERDLPAELRDAVREHGLLYRRNFRAPSDSWEHHPTLDAVHKPWPDAFFTQDRADVEQACDAMGLDCRWEPDGSVTTEFVSSGFTDHPALGEPLWFNQLHAQTMTLRTYGPTNIALIERYYPQGRARPYETCFGDGTPVPAEWIEAIYDAMDAHTVAFPWRRGDVMIIDNILTAHGRNPFRGRRDTQVALLD